MSKKDKVEYGVDLLLEDHHHFGESLWRNDELGERRFNFLVGIITAATAGLGALYSRGQSAAPGNGPLGMNANTLLIVQIAVGGLLLYALMTYFRMLQGNRVTREYHETLRYIRRELAALGALPADYSVPRAAPRAPIFRAGLAEATGLFCGMLLGGLLALLGVPFGGAAVCGLGLFAVAALIAQNR